MLSLAVFPQSALLIKPCKASFPYPVFGNYCECMYFIAFDYLYRYVFAQNCLYSIGKRLAAIPSITQNSFYFCQLFFILLKSE